MTLAESVLAIGLAGLVLYGIGIPLAWFLPAPERAPWAHRIAIAPVFSILVSAALAWLLRLLGVALHPVQLLGLLGAAWAIAWRYRRKHWGVVAALRHALAPCLLVVASGAAWAASLAGYGLYLPNRDFKNHAYFVAMVAWLRTGDPDLIVRAAPLDPPTSAAAYPVALHTILGWALPLGDWNATAITAAAAVICTSISLPLAFVSLARMWAPMPRGLDWFAGASAVCLSGLTIHFAYGSVVILVGTALYSAGLVVAWLWLERPSMSSALALAATVAGLLVLHIAEAVGLALIIGVAVAFRGGRSLATARGAKGYLVLGLVVAGLAGLTLSVNDRLVGLLDVAPKALTENRLDLLSALFGPGFHAIGRPYELGLVWLILAAVGAWLAVKDDRSRLPIVALLTTWILYILATWAGLPTSIRLVSAPWYGEGPRVAMLAGAPLVLLAGLAVTRLADTSCKDRGAELINRFAAVAIAVVLLVAGLLNMVPQRRGNLESTLAGAGDTPLLAAHLIEVLREGEVVLNLESDGTANLFAFARVPVLTAWDYSQAGSAAGMTVEQLAQNLMRISHPDVATALESMKVKFIALGTSSVFWGQSPGYSVDLLLQQRQLSVEARGTDMVVLRYQP